MVTALVKETGLTHEGEKHSLIIPSSQACIDLDLLFDKMVT